MCYIKRGCNGGVTRWTFPKYSHAIREKLNSLVGYVREGAHQKKYFCCTDIETIMPGLSNESAGKLRFTNIHHLMSWSIVTNIPQSKIYVKGLHKMCDVPFHNNELLVLHRQMVSCNVVFT